MSDRKWREYKNVEKIAYDRGETHLSVAEFSSNMRINLIEAEALRDCETKLAKAEAVIQRLKEGLEFYGNENNYSIGVPMCSKNSPLSGQIKIADQGGMAKHILKQVAEMEAEREG